MSIEVTIRHMDADNNLKDYVKSKAEELMNEFRGVEHIHVVLNNEKHRFTSEVFLQANHMRVEAKETSDVIMTAVDESFNKLEKQVRKHFDKIKDHKQVMKESEKN